ncbi:MAG: phosphoenolpyruvate carboxykinase (GTP) [Anaerolineae bacterium]
MASNPLEFLKAKLEPRQLAKLEKVGNSSLLAFVAQYVEHCQPDRVFVCNDSPEDVEYIREAALRDHEEGQLATPGHTYHFDGFHDQARDRKNTRLLLPKGVELGTHFETLDRDTGLADVGQTTKGIMRGHTMYVRLVCLGPTNSVFSLLAVQLTDSAYVAHNEDLLYRHGYDEFVRRGPGAEFFRFLHSAGELDNDVSKNVDKRRIYIDVMENMVYSVNTQYGGNSIGLKKLSMRLAINKASEEGWLCEHMFVLGVGGKDGRTSYFTGAFPSLCGKTSTAMLEGETIVGDDIAYIRNVGGALHAVNSEKGIFGIIQGVNAQDDPILWHTLHSPGEIIFSNVLVTDDGSTYWIGKGTPVPERGVNHSGRWYPCKTDNNGREITPSHPNARFTLSLTLLGNVDPNLDAPDGVPISGIIYGGRDSDTWVPVEEAFDWNHGVITKGACLESETTAATLGKEGVREFNPMSNLDFLSVPIGRYLQDNLRMGEGLHRTPRIYSVNYFLRDKGGAFLNSKLDKKVWLRWMEQRAHGEVGAIRTPTGFIPRYEDLAALFQSVLGRDYSHQDYVKQFSLRVPENLAKIERVLDIYCNQVLETPRLLFDVLEQQRERLQAAQARLGDFISPDVFAAESQ